MHRRYPQLLCWRWPGEGEKRGASALYSLLDIESERRRRRREKRLLNLVVLLLVFLTS
jgi:hypothetical protein